MRKYLIAVLFSLIGTLTYAQKKKAIVILLDGIPFDVIHKVNKPNIDRITTKGGLYQAYVGGEKGGKSESPTISAVGYNSMLTGTWANKHNVWDNDIAKPNYNYPTFFKIARDKRPNIKLGIYSTWLDNRTKLLGEQLPETNYLKLDVSFDGYENDTIAFPHDKGKLYIKKIDEFVVEKAVNSIRVNAPDISWVYLEFTDDMGHQFGDSKEFYESVENADRLVGKIHDEILKRTNEDWLILITTDHGRDAKTGKNHGGQTDRERTTWIATNKPISNANGLSIVDIFPSICKFMSIRIPKSVSENLDGKSFIR